MGKKRSLSSSDDTSSLAASPSSSSSQSSSSPASSAASSSSSSSKQRRAAARSKRRKKSPVRGKAKERRKDPKKERRKKHAKSAEGKPRRQKCSSKVESDGSSSEGQGKKRSRRKREDAEHCNGIDEADYQAHNGPGGELGMTPFGYGKGSFGKGGCGKGGYGKGGYGGGWVPFFPAQSDHWPSNSQYDRRGNFRSFSARDERESRPHWAPGQGRNADLEAERLTGVPLARVYSEHDDRRGGSPGGSRRRGPSPSGTWRHDLFEEMVKK